MDLNILQITIQNERIRIGRPAWRKVLREAGSHNYICRGGKFRAVSNMIPVPMAPDNSL
jgi:hypothetical protein